MVSSPCCASGLPGELQKQQPTKTEQTTCVQAPPPHCALLLPPLQPSTPALTAAHPSLPPSVSGPGPQDRSGCRQPPDLGVSGPWGPPQEDTAPLRSSNIATLSDLESLRALLPTPSRLHSPRKGCGLPPVALPRGVPPRVRQSCSVPGKHLGRSHSDTLVSPLTGWLLGPRVTPESEPRGPCLQVQLHTDLLFLLPRIVLAFPSTSLPCLSLAGISMP